MVSRKIAIAFLGRIGEGVNAVVQLVGAESAPRAADGGRERAEISASGASYEAAYAQLEGQVRPGWLLLHVRRVDAGETP